VFIHQIDVLQIHFCLTVKDKPRAKLALVDDDAHRARGDLILMESGREHNFRCDVTAQPPAEAVVWRLCEQDQRSNCLESIFTEANGTVSGERNFQAQSSLAVKLDDDMARMSVSCSGCRRGLIFRQRDCGTAEMVVAPVGGICSRILLVLCKCQNAFSLQIISLLERPFSAFASL